MTFIFATIYVKNLEVSIHFYETVIGLKLVRRFRSGNEGDEGTGGEIIIGSFQLNLRHTFSLFKTQMEHIWKLLSKGSLEGK